MNKSSKLLSIGLLSISLDVYGYALLVLAIFICWWCWRRMRKTRDIELKKRLLAGSFGTIFGTMFLTLLYISLHVLFRLPSDYVGGIMIAIAVSAFISYFVLKWYLIDRNIVKIDGIKFWLDKTKRTAMVLPNNYSGDIVIPSSFINKKDGATYSVTDIYKAFSECSELTSVIIPEGVTSIEYGVFLGCESLKSISIPGSVSSLGYGLLGDSLGLTSIKVAKGNPKYDSREDCNAIIETATNKLVYGCKNTVIPASVTSIEDEAFPYCMDITSVTIPQNVTSIGGYAFVECLSLQDVICLGERVPTSANDAFEDTPISQATLHVPAASIEAYRATEPWSKFKSIVAIE